MEKINLTSFKHHSQALLLHQRKKCRSPNAPVPPRNFLNLYLMLWVTLHLICPLHWFQSCTCHIVTKHNRTCKFNLLIFFKNQTLILPATSLVTLQVTRRYVWYSTPDGVMLHGLY